MILQCSAIGKGAIMNATFYARTSDHGYETCVEHLSMTGCLAGGFAQSFGHLDDGLLAGLVHDLGKYSDAFQRRIQNPDHSGLVDHSTAGAMLLVQNGCPLVSMAVAGHHAGLADFGSQGELEGATYSGRMNKAFSAGDRNPLSLANEGKCSCIFHSRRSKKEQNSFQARHQWMVSQKNSLSTPT